MNIPVESSPEFSRSEVSGLAAETLGVSPDDLEATLAFNKAIALLNNIKLVRGGAEVNYTLRKRKILKNFLNDYIKKNYPSQLDDLEETIASMQ